MTNMKRMTNTAANIFITAGAFGLFAMTIIIGWKVFGRYVLDSTPNWAEQSALVLMIWYVCFAAAAGVREGFHIRIVALENTLAPKSQKILRLFGDVVVGICGITMLIWGGQLVVGTWNHAVPTLGIPRGAVYLALPIAGSLIALFSLERIVEEFNNDVSIKEENN